MKTTAYKIITAIPGIPMLLNAVLFITDPEKVTADLGMPLLDGIGRSTQLADLGGLFMFGAIMIFYGVIKSKGQYLRIGALLLGLIAVLRIVAWAINGAELATVLIISEILLVIWLLAGAVYLDKLQH
jgi:hypothetical protein